MAKNTNQLVADNGGKGGRRASNSGTDNIAAALRQVTNGVQSAINNGQGTPVTNTAANPNGLDNIAGAMQGIVNGVQNKTGNAAITNINNGKSGSGGRGGTATYIASDGSKKSGIANPTPGQTPQFYTDLGNLYQKAYDDQIAANNAALEEARARAQEATDAQIAALAEQYAGTNRQLYRDYMNSRRVLPQQMAAMGYNGGLSESSLLRLNNSYEEGLNENERARLAQETAYNQALQQNLYDAGVRTNEANQAARQNLYSQQAALQEAIYRDAQNRAATMAASGDFSEYERLGFSPSEIAYLKQMWRAMNPTLA